MSDVAKVEPYCKRHNYISCPHCRELNILVGSWPVEDVAIPVESDDRGYPIRQVAYKTISYRTCEKCGKPFTVDFGTSKFNVFKSPRSCTNIRDIRLMAEYISEWYTNFSIFVAESPTRRPKHYYYMWAEDCGDPIFITRKQAMEFLRDHRKARGFCNRLFMTRYR